MSFKDILSFPHEAVPLAQGAAFSKIMTPCNGRECIQLAGIPNPCPLPVFHIESNFIVDIETKAGRADIRAGCAGQATLAQLIPQRALHAHAEQGGEIAYIEIQAIGESRPLLAEYGVESLHVSWSRTPDGCILQQIMTRIGADIDGIGIADIGQMQIVAFISGERPHAFTEGIFIAGGETFDADNQCLPPPVVVVWICVPGIENMIEQLDGMQVARVHAEDDSARVWTRRFYLEFLGIVEFEKCFLGGQQEFLWRQDRGGVIQPQLCRIPDGVESVMTIRLDRSPDTVESQEIPNKGWDILFINDCEAHCHLLEIVVLFCWRQFTPVIVTIKSRVFQ